MSDFFFFRQIGTRKQTEKRIDIDTRGKKHERRGTDNTDRQRDTDGQTDEQKELKKKKAA